MAIDLTPPGSSAEEIEARAALDPIRQAFEAVLAKQDASRGPITEDDPRWAYMSAAERRNGRVSAPRAPAARAPDVGGNFWRGGSRRQ
jgi:hypothetical protein